MHASESLASRILARGAALILMLGTVACSDSVDVAAPENREAQPPPPTDSVVTPPLPNRSLPSLTGSLVFSRGGTLLRALPDGSDVEAIAQFRHPPYYLRFSPDGKQVATARFGPRSALLCFGGITDAERCVPYSGGVATGFEWSASGRELIAAGGAPDGGRTPIVSALDPASLRYRTIVPNVTNSSGGSVALRPDGTTVTFVSGRQLWRTDIAGTQAPVPLAGFESRNTVWAARWSADGRAVAMLSWNALDHTLAVARADGSDYRVLARIMHSENQLLDRPMWSPNGTAIGLTLYDCVMEPCEERVVIYPINGAARSIALRDGILHDWR